MKIQEVYSIMGENAITWEEVTKRPVSVKDRAFLIHEMHKRGVFDSDIARFLEMPKPERAGKQRVRTILNRYKLKYTK